MKKGYKKLFVWQKADELAFKIYIATKNFPKEELYGLTSQLRRASISVAVNLVEGYGRQNQKETKHFVNIALGSLAETEYLLDFSFRLNLFSDQSFGELYLLREETGRLLWRFYKCL
jgi:four helix bundle protein